MRRHRLAGSGATLLVALALGTPTGSAVLAGGGPTIHTYPSASCPQAAEGLQACVDGAADGDVVELANEVIDEFLLIDRSLTLRPSGPGLRPQLESIVIVDRPATAGAGDPTGVDVTLRDLRIRGGVRASFAYPSLDRITIRRLAVGRDSTTAKGITVESQSPVAVDVRGSYARTLERQSASFQVYAVHATGTSSVVAIGNEFTQDPEGGSGSGVYLAMTGGGTMTASVLANVIHDVVGGNAGGASGVFLYPRGTSSLTARLVGNTLDTVGSDGIYLRNDVTSPGSVRLLLFNNIASHAVGAAVNLGSADSDTFTLDAGHNARFANGRASEFDGQDPGPGNRVGDPRYRDRASRDLRLRPSSPLIDAGLTCTSGGQSATDAAGRARWAGQEVDIGAFESSAGRATGLARTGDGGPDSLSGTSGRDILCGLGGPDTLDGKGGPDYVDGGPGGDRLTGGSATDRVLGRTGDDRLCLRDGVAGNDLGDGGPGRDRGRRDIGDVLLSVEIVGVC